MNTAIGQNIRRWEAWDKVTGKAVYTDDLPVRGMLCARLLTSRYAHARIISIDTAQALAIEGVKAVITGKDCPQLFGVLIMDRPALAQDTVRYAGEPLAIVVAVDEETAELGVRRIAVSYEQLRTVLSPSEAIRPGAPLIHPQLGSYEKIQTDLYPKAGTNIASHYRIRKGDAALALSHSDVVAREHFVLPPSDHLAMEVRSARAEITAEGTVVITTSSQAPYAVRMQLSEALGIPVGKIQVKVPLLGGAFGGKAPVTLEILAYLATRQVNGRPVRLTITREQDMVAAPCRLGLEADIALGATKDGMLCAAEMTYLLDCGAYADISPYMTKAIAGGCTGPYGIEHVSCDALCVYSNRTYATSYRSFSHESFTFCVERTLDILARSCGIDPLELRLNNAICPGDLTPTQVACTPSLIGDLSACIQKLKTISEWDGGKVTAEKETVVRAKGAACFWKSATPPTDAISGALITFNADGSLNLNTGVVEMGSGSKTQLAQILAEKLKLDIEKIHLVMGVDTRLSPEHWKTVASITLYMAGRAVVRAADDLIRQLCVNGAQIFGCSPDDVVVAFGQVYPRNNPLAAVTLKDVAGGYQAADGSSIGEPVLGRGGMMLKGLSKLDPKTGRGKTGPAWTVGAQAVEVEVDTKTYTYRILTASTVMDVGAVINPDGMRSMVMGGMSMGLSLASREAFSYDTGGVMQTPNLRTYKLLHIGQEPEYRVDFVETPQEDSPYGIRGYSEHGIIGIPAALANALSAALGLEITGLPLKPEKLWRLSAEERP